MKTKSRKGHGIQHGQSKTKIYTIWMAMKNRCYEPVVINYENYGGRGITVCDEWRWDFLTFKQWADDTGYTEGLSLDRIDNDLGYGPDNCRWATEKEQANNRRSNLLFEIFGETKTWTQWAEDPRCVVKPMTLRYRIVEGGWDPEEALTTPAGLEKRKDAGQ